MPRDVEKELSVLLAQASDKLLAKDQAEVQQQQAQQMLQDPIVQQQQEELNIRRMEVERKAQADMMRAKVDMDKAEMTDARERERIASQEKITGAQIGARIASDVLEGEFQGVELAEKEKMEGARLGVEIAIAVMDNEGRDGYWLKRQ